MIDVLLLAAQQVFTPSVMTVIVLASVFGLFVGAMPGLSATMATALLVPLTFAMDPIPALGAIIATSAMALFAGDIPAALLRMPGTPSSAAYVDDLYNMTRKGKAGRGLAACLIFSAIGGMFATVVLIIGAPVLARFAANFSSDEYFWLAALGLSCAVIIFAGSPLKGMISLLIGLLIATVGTDLSTGTLRYTFGVDDLQGGIGFVPALIGMFALAEVLRFATDRQKLDAPPPSEPIRLRGQIVDLLRRHWRENLRGSIVGTLTGILPGAGGGVATWISYSIGRRMGGRDKTRSEEDRSLGAVVEASSANNSSLGGAWIPTLVFGIPGDAITAIVIGVLLMKGITPGPLVFTQNADLAYGLLIVFVVANLLMIPLGLMAIRSAGLILRVPREALMPVIVMLAILGAFAVSNSSFDIGIMLALALLAYAMERNGFPVAPAILAIVLAPVLEKNLLMSLMKARGDVMGLVDRPIAAVLAVMVLLLWIGPLIRSLRGMLTRRGGRKAADEQILKDTQ